MRFDVTTDASPAPAVGGAPSPETFLPQVEELLEELEAVEELEDMERLNLMEARVWPDGVLGEEGRVQGVLRDLPLDMNGVAVRAPQCGEEMPPPPAWPRLAEISVPLPSSFEGSSTFLTPRSAAGRWASSSRRLGGA